MKHFEVEPEAAEAIFGPQIKLARAYAHKLAHDLIGEAGLHSESEGEGRDRHIVISKPE